MSGSYVLGTGSAVGWVKMIKLPYWALTKAMATVGLLVAASSGAFASPSLTLNTNGYSDSLGGGEFTTVGSGLSTLGYTSSTAGVTFGAAGDFETFCLAYNEEFVPGSTFNYTLGTTTMGNGSNPNVPLTNGVALLYSEFAQGLLGNYDYSDTNNGVFANRKQAAEALQVALWWASGEDTGGTYSQGAPLPGSLPSYDSYYVNLLTNDFGAAWASTAATGPGLDGVKIIVLDNNNSNDGSVPYSQPQLYYGVPDNGTTAILLGLALLGLGAVKWRLRKTV